MAEQPDPTPISDALRDAILQSGVSRYILSQQVGVSESVLSRFLNGKQGITLETAERLAVIFGLTVSPGVSLVQSPKVSPVQVTASISKTPEAAKELAEHHARNAHENHFQSRRGVWDLGSNLFCFYNNNPYKMVPGLRDRESALLCAMLEQKGGIVLGRGSYPPAGEADAGYTTTLVVGAPKGASLQTLSNMYAMATQLGGQVLTFAEAVAKMPGKTIGHATTQERRENAQSGNGGTLYSHKNLIDAADGWSKKSRRFAQMRWAVHHSDTGAAIVDLLAKHGSPPEFFKPILGQVFAVDATR